jgi:hypothetical protein
MPEQQPIAPQPEQSPTSAYDRLPAPHRRFVDAYFACGMVEYRAYLQAGYGGEEPPRAEAERWQRWHQNVRSNASRLTTSDNVQAAIRERMKAAAMGADEALFRLSQQAESPQMQFLRADGTVDLEGLLQAGLGHLVKGTRFNAQGKLIVEFHDAQAALKLIGEHHSLFRQVQELRFTEPIRIIDFAGGQADGQADGQDATEEEDDAAG